MVLVVETARDLRRIFQRAIPQVSMSHLQRRKQSHEQARVCDIETVKVMSKTSPHKIFVAHRHHFVRELIDQVVQELGVQRCLIVQRDEVGRVNPFLSIPASRLVDDRIFEALHAELVSHDVRGHDVVVSISNKLQFLAVYPQNELIKGVAVIFL